ncbi:hypothetical protein H2201_004925 [Coniosporium apollinis]|uniref:Uncharacterized protein n=1 Tax=Coniosporium apollinis TaxID=61459 RepID=A0ABQ9NUW7_9PEZI|nr:hypothetical protein H2201_004925 [Coniosporium apollinis]
MKLHAAIIVSLLAFASANPVPGSDNPAAALEKRDKWCRVVTPDGPVACRKEARRSSAEIRRIRAHERFGVDCTREGESIFGEKLPPSRYSSSDEPKETNARNYLPPRTEMDPPGSEETGPSSGYTRSLRDEIRRLEEQRDQLKAKIQALDRSIEESTERPATTESNARKIYTNSDVMIDPAMVNKMDREAAVAVVAKAKGILSELVAEMQAAIDNKEIGKLTEYAELLKADSQGYKEHLNTEGRTSAVLTMSEALDRVAREELTANGIKKSLATILSRISD